MKGRHIWQRISSIWMYTISYNFWLSWNPEFLMITSGFAHSIPPSWARFQGKISDCIQYQRALRESTGRIPFPKTLCTNFWMSECGLFWAIPKMGTSSYNGSNKNKTWKYDEPSGFRNQLGPSTSLWNLVFSRAHPSWAACCGTPLVPCHVPLDNDHSLLEMNGPSWQAGKLAGAAQIHHT